MARTCDVMCDFTPVDKNHIVSSISSLFQFNLFSLDAICFDLNDEKHLLLRFALIYYFARRHPSPPPSLRRRRRIGPSANPLPLRCRRRRIGSAPGCHVGGCLFCGWGWPRAILSLTSSTREQSRLRQRAVEFIQQSITQARTRFSFIGNHGNKCRCRG